MVHPQSAPRYSRTDGFTLIEIVITIALVGILAGIASLIILQGARAFSDEQARGNVLYQARLAAERVAREARLVRSCADIAGPANPSSALTFTDVNGNPVAFSVVAGNLYRGPDLLATGIISPQPFGFFASDGTTATSACPGIWFIQIDVTAAQGAETLQVRTRAHPRNF